MALSNAGDRLSELKQLAEVLSFAIDGCESMRDLAALARQYRETLREIDEIEGGESVDDGVTEIILRHRQER